MLTKGKRVKVFERPDTNTIILTPYSGVKKANKSGILKKDSGTIKKFACTIPPLHSEYTYTLMARNLKCLKRRPGDLRRRRPDKTAR